MAEDDVETLVCVGIHAMVRHRQEKTCESVLVVIAELILSLNGRLSCASAQIQITISLAGWFSGTSCNEFIPKVYVYMYMLAFCRPWFSVVAALNGIFHTWIMDQNFDIELAILYNKPHGNLWDCMLTVKRFV